MNQEKDHVVGRVGKKPILKETTTGKTVAEFSVATDQLVKDENNNSKKIERWLNVTLWNYDAKRAVSKLKVGEIVSLFGTIKESQNEKYNDELSASICLRIDKSYLTTKTEEKQG